MPNLITVSLPESTWRALLDAVPVSKETYTGPGEEVFASVQAISHAIESARKGEQESLSKLAAPTDLEMRLARAVLNPLTDAQRRAVIVVVAHETMQEDHA